MSKTITGLFDNPTDAARAAAALEARGFSAERMSLIAGESFDKQAFAIDSNTKLPEGIAVGATSGAAVGALAAGLTSVAALSTGGVGLVAAGPIVAALTGAGAGATAGGALGGLVGATIPEHEVKHYENALSEGSILLGVDCCDGDEKTIAEETLEACEAKTVSYA